MYNACSESCLQGSAAPYSFRTLERRPREASAAVSAASVFTVPVLTADSTSFRYRPPVTEDQRALRGAGGTARA